MDSTSAKDDFKEITVVIPCYKSANTIPAVVQSIESTFEKANISKYEINLVIDDAREDTLLAVKTLRAINSRIQIIELTRNYGQHAAIFAGIAYAEMPLVITMDDDGQHLAKEIPKLLLALTSEVDVVYGVAVDDEHSFLRNSLFSSR